MKVNKQLTLEKKEMSTMKKALNVIINYHSKRIEISYGIIMKSERNTVEGLVFHSQQSQLNQIKLKLFILGESKFNIYTFCIMLIIGVGFLKRYKKFDNNSFFLLLLRILKIVKLKDRKYIVAWKLKLLIRRLLGD